MNKINFNKKVKEDFLDYAGAVIKSRAISSIEDNMKPVHRRILYVMGQDKLWANKKTVKSANIVGKTMMYHPHGDSSIYDAMVRLAQPWKMRYPLVEMQGNMGSILGDGPAASRYTEARLSKFGELMLQDIDKNAVPFKPSYDETHVEPVILPSVFPNMLANGNAGIAVGMSANLVPHNLKEVIDGTLAYLKNKHITIDNLMKHIPGPDFPTGGVVVDGQRLPDIYKTGSGAVTVRAKFNIIDEKGKKVIEFYEVPYLINIETGVIAPMKKLVVEEGFDLIEDYENNTNSKGVMLRVRLKKNANVFKVLETLWANTRLQVTQKISNTVIVSGNPRVLNLKEMIAHYVDHRHEVIVNVANYELEKVLSRIEVLEGISTALDRIDEVIELIKNSKGRDLAREGLIQLLSINETQANSILNMRLSRINALDKIEVLDELKGLNITKEELEGKINSPATRETQIRSELLNLKNNYSDERRTTIGFSEINESDIALEQMNIMFFENGKIFATQRELKDFSFNKKSSPMNQQAITLLSETNNKTELSVFLKDTTMEKINTLTLGLENYDSLQLESPALAALDLNDSGIEFVGFVTKSGLVKKTRAFEYAKMRKSSKTINLKKDDELIAVFPIYNDSYIYILGESGKVVKFHHQEVTPTSRATVGVRGIDGKALSAVSTSGEKKILSINSEGQGKLTDADDFVVTARGSSGQVMSDNTIFLSSGVGSQIFVRADGKNNLLELDKISTKGRTAIGAKLVNGAPKNGY